MIIISRINCKVMNLRESKQFSIDPAESRQSKGKYPTEFKTLMEKAVNFNNQP